MNICEMKCISQNEMTKYFPNSHKNKKNTKPNTTKIMRSPGRSSIVEVLYGSDPPGLGVTLCRNGL